LPTPGRWGEYLSFNSAWGYWISAWIGNVSYLVILFAALSYFFPLFGEGNNKAAIAGASVVLWSLHWMILRGMRTAARANALTTVAKIVPLLLFIGLVIAAFQRETFSVDFWARRHWAAPWTRSKAPCWSPSGCSSASKAPTCFPPVRRSAPTSGAPR
jgi:amino acid transporter